MFLISTGFGLSRVSCSEEQTGIQVSRQSGHQRWVEQIPHVHQGRPITHTTVLRVALQMLQCPSMCWCWRWCVHDFHTSGYCRCRTVQSAAMCWSLSEPGVELHPTQAIRSNNFQVHISTSGLVTLQHCGAGQARILNCEKYPSINDYRFYLWFRTLIWSVCYH